MLRILLVGDERSVLNAIRGRTRLMHTQSRLGFLAGGIQAPEAPARGSAAVAIAGRSIMAIDGAELPAEAEKVWPQAVPFVLSGYAEPGAIMRATGTARLYFARRFHAAASTATIARNSSHEPCLRDEPTQRRVGRIEGVRSLAGIYQEVVPCLRGANPSSAARARIIGRGMATTATALKLVKSRCFGIPQKTHSVRRAISLLAAKTLLGLVLNCGLFAERAGGELPSAPGAAPSVGGEDPLPIAGVKDRWPTWLETRRAVAEGARS
jgi:hypothetical protein